MCDMGVFVTNYDLTFFVFIISGNVCIIQIAFCGTVGLRKTERKPGSGRYKTKYSFENWVNLVQSRSHGQVQPFRALWVPRKWESAINIDFTSVGSPFFSCVF